MLSVYMIASNVDQLFIVNHMPVEVRAHICINFSSNHISKLLQLRQTTR